MAKAVELSTVQAVKEIKNLRDQIKSLAKELGAGRDQLNFISKAMTGAADKVSKLGRTVNTLTRENKALKANLKAANAELKKLKTQAAAAAEAQDKLRSRTERLKEVGKQMNIMMRSQAVQQRIVTKGASEQANKFKDLGRRMQIVRRSQEQMNKTGAATNEVFADIASSAVLTFGPLSGVGARIIALLGILKRSGPGMIVLTLGLTALAAIFVKVAAASFKAGLQMQKIMGTLRAATGSASGAKREFKFVSDVAQEMGLNIASAARQFAKLSAAARGTALEGKGARDIFEGIAIASTAMRLSAEQTEGALRAIEQMISKGTVQAEELRGQLGERLPGAFQLAAKAMGVTTRELGKMLEQGEVLAEDMLPKLAKLLKETFSAEAAVAAGEVTASFERFKTQLFLLFEELERRQDLLDFLADLAGLGERLIKGLRTTSARGEFILLGKEFAKAEKALMRLQDVSQEEIKAFTPEQLKRFNTEFKRVSGEFELAFDALLNFTQERAAELAALEIRGPNLRGLELGRLLELREVMKEINETGALTTGVTEGGGLSAGIGGVSSMMTIPESSRAVAIPDLVPGSFENAEKGIEAMQALQRAIDNLKIPGDLGDDVAELLLEFENLGKTDLQQGIAELDSQMNELIESIARLKGPDGIPEDAFEAFKTEQINAVRAAVQGLQQDLRDLNQQEIDEIKKGTLGGEAKEQRILTLQIAGQEALLAGETERADKMKVSAQMAELTFAAMEDLSELVERIGSEELTKMTAELVLQRMETERLNELSDDLADKIKEREKAAKKLAAAAKKEADNFAKVSAELENEITVLRQRLDTEGEMGDLLAFELALKEKHKGIDEDLLDALVARKAVQLELKDLDDAAEKARKKALTDETALLKKKESQATKLGEELDKTNALISTMQLRIAGEGTLADALELRATLAAKYNLVEAEGVELLAKRLELLAKLGQENKAKEELADLIRANAVLRQRIAGNDEFADQMEARFELMKTFPGMTTAQLQVLQKELELNKELTEVLKEQNDLEKVRAELAQDFAQSIGQAFEDAVIEGKKLSDVLQALLDDINRIILRVLVTKPLENFLTGILTGTDPTGSKAGPGGTPFFGGLLGSLFSSGDKESVSRGRAGGVGGAGVGGGFTSIVANPGEENLGQMIKKVLGMGEAAETVGAKMEGGMAEGIVATTLATATEKVTTVQLTASLVAFDLAVKAATASLSAMAATSGGGAGGGDLFSSGFGGLLGGTSGGASAGGAFGTSGTAGATAGSGPGQGAGGFLSSSGLGFGGAGAGGAGSLSAGSAGTAGLGGGSAAGLGGGSAAGAAAATPFAAYAAFAIGALAVIYGFYKFIDTFGLGIFEPFTDFGKGLTTGFGIPKMFGFAKGGHTSGSKPIVVGEEGPEIFTPSGPGFITPNSRMQSSQGTVVNLTQNIITDNPPEFRRSARTNLRTSAKAAHSAFRRT